MISTKLLIKLYNVYILYILKILIGEYMQITNSEELLNNDNIKLRGEIPKMINSNVFIHGKDNILFCEEGVTLENSRIDFHQDNSILYLSRNNHNYHVSISLNRDSVCFIGKNNFFNGMTTVVASETKNIIIGSDCLFSYNIIIRTSDGHGIYSTENKERLNHAKSIYVGDHVWFGQNSFVLKGTEIHSGSIIGAGSILSNKIIPSNVTFAGNPARLIKKNVFWTAYSTHFWGPEELKKTEKYNSDIYTFKSDDTTLNFNQIDEDLSILSAEKSLEYILNSFHENKNRFAFINNDTI